MPKQIVSAAMAPTVGKTPGQATSPLAQAIRFGPMLFVSGQGGVDPLTDTIVDDDVGTQTRAALHNLMTILEAGGATAKNIVSMRVTLRDMSQFSRFDEVWQEFFHGEQVTRTCYGAIPNRDGIHVQIDCWAMFDEPPSSMADQCKA